MATAATALPGARGTRRCIAGVPFWCRGGPVKPRCPRPSGRRAPVSNWRSCAEGHAGCRPERAGRPGQASLCGADQNGNRQTPNASSPMPLNPLPSFHRKLGWPMSVPVGGRVPLLVASTAVSVHGPLKVPWAPFDGGEPALEELRCHGSCQPNRRLRRRAVLGGRGPVRERLRLGVDRAGDRVGVVDTWCADRQRDHDLHRVAGRHQVRVDQDPVAHASEVDSGAASSTGADACVGGSRRTPPSRWCRTARADRCRDDKADVAGPMPPARSHCSPGGVERHVHASGRSATAPVLFGIVMQGRREAEVPSGGHVPGLAAVRLATTCPCRVAEQRRRRGTADVAVALVATCGAGSG